MRPLKAIIAVVAVLGSTLGITACGSDSASTASTATTAAAPATATTVKIELGEKGAKYFVTADKVSVPAGDVTFSIDNVGSMHHEMGIFKTDLAADKLPLNAEGKVDEEKVELLAEALYTKPLRGDDDHRIRDGRGVDFTVNLPAGKYVLLCNLAGHYKAGQSLAFTVEGDAFSTAATPTTTEPAAPAADAAVTGTPIAVTLGEKGPKYFVTTDKATVAAGETTFVIDNTGTTHHEMGIFKTDLAADKLPLNAENKVDEDKVELLAEALYTKPLRGDDDHRIRDGRGVNFTITLPAGKYVLLCNLAGHYKAGQFVPLTVT